MYWYAIQLITGKETQVITAFKDFGVEVIMPYKPVILRRGGNIKLIYRPMMPGYVIARLQDVNFYRYQRNQRVEKMMIRICGNGYDAVPLNEDELTFFSNCCDNMKPLKIKKRFENKLLVGKSLTGYDIINSPPWAENAIVDWYDIDKFKVQLRIRTSGIMKNHTFTLAAYDIDYSGSYFEQLQDLSQDGLGQFGHSIR